MGVHNAIELEQAAKEAAQRSETACCKNNTEAKSENLMPECTCEQPTEETVPIDREDDGA